MATFKELDLDHFVIIQCAPNGSARNKVGRSMSVLNLSLAHVALKRGKMADWAEAEVKNCTTMKSVRDVTAAVEKKRAQVLEDIPILETALAHAVVEDIVVSGIADIVEAAQKMDAVNATVVSDMILQYLGTERLMSG